MLESLPVDIDAGAADRVEFEPRWLRAIAFAAAAAVASFGAVGLAAAVAGVYRAYIVFPLGAVAWIALLVLARPVLRDAGARAPGAQVVAGLGVVFVVAMAAWNVRHASQHVLINRDPGAYTNAGRWIAVHGNLQVSAATGAFAHQAAVTFGSFAMYPTSSGVLSFQFAHLLPALLAVAHDLGGDRLMFAATPLLGAVALLAFFVAAWRVLRNPLVALAALVSFAFLLPEVSFSRDSFSEIPMQVLLFTALWILADRRSFRRPRVVLVVGLLLGLLQAARIDALVALAGLPLLFAVAFVSAAPADRRSVAVGSGACALGLAPGIALGFTDVVLRSNGYFHDLRSDVNQLVVLVVASIVLSALVVALVPRLARRVSRLPAGLDWTAAGVVAVIGFGAWFARPRLQHVHGAANLLVSGLQQAAHVTVDPTRNYAERSMVWMSWYLGPVALAAAIVAAALVVRALMRGQSWYALAGIALLGPAAAVYLWRPNISTDQIWVMRRYLFSALPLLTLLAFGLVAACARVRLRSMPRLVPIAVAVVIGAAAVASPISTVAAVPNITEQRGDALALRDACRTVGPRAAIVLLQGSTGLLYEWVPQSLRGWCNVPVAVMPASTPNRAAVLTQLAAGWASDGRTLWVVADRDATIRGAAPAVPAAGVHHTPDVTNPYLLRRTVVRRPDDYLPEHFSLVMAPVPRA